MLSVDESDLPDDESEGDGSDSGSSGTCVFPFRFEDSVGCVDDSVGRVDNSVRHIDDSVGRVCGVGSGVFIPIIIESIGDIIPLVVFVPIGVDSKGG